VQCGQNKCSYPVPFSHHLHGEAHLRKKSSERVNTSKLNEPFYNVSLSLGNGAAFVDPASPDCKEIVSNPTERKRERFRAQEAFKVPSSRNISKWLTQGHSYSDENLKFELGSSKLKCIFFFFFFTF